MAAARPIVSLALVSAVLSLPACGGGGDKETGTQAPARPAQRREAPVDRLSLSRQAGQAIVFSFDGATVPVYVRRILREGRGGGVILFGDNVVDARRLRRMTRVLQRAARGSALVAVDQEGGPVRIVPFAAPQRSQSALAGPAQARASARAASRDLRRLGINVNLAPVVDTGAGGALGGRVFEGGPERVAALTAAAVRGYAARPSVAPTAKHFPGLGGAVANTDDTEVAVRRSRRELEREDLEPFRAAIAAGVPIVMASHALYPALDRRRIASQSPRILRELLRRELGFRGVVVTDSIEARAVLARSSVARAAVRSVAAGATIVLSTGPGSYRDVYDALLARARASKSFRARLREAAARVLALKRRMGLRTPG